MLGLPHLCVHCEFPIARNQLLCLPCLSEIDWAQGMNSTIYSQLASQFPLNHVFHACLFRKFSPSQTLLKAFKYRGRRDIAFQCGVMLGNILKAQLQETVTLVPVPLHWRKSFSRGYNQAEILAQGIQSVLPAQIEPMLERKSFWKSLTQKNRIDRNSKAQLHYSCSKNYFNQEFNHIVLVDDVLTTGATSLKCLNALKPHIQANMYSIACFALAE